MREYENIKEISLMLIRDSVLSDEVYLENNFLYIKNSESREVSFSVNLNETPTLVTGKETTFQKLKPHILDLKFALEGYINLVKNIEKLISLTERSSIHININMNEYTPNVNITLKIGDIGSFEININEISGVYISAFSDDFEVNNYLRKNCEKLFEQIYISKSQIVKLLSVHDAIIK